MQAIAQTSEPDTADRKYFTLAPNLLFALCRDPFDLAVWLAVKLVAGDTGTCTLSAEDGAALTGMATGKGVDARKHLLTVGALTGAIRRDPGYPQPVWHLRIPERPWERNIRWCDQIEDDPIHVPDTLSARGIQRALTARAHHQILYAAPDLPKRPTKATPSNTPKATPVQNDGTHEVARALTVRAIKRGKLTRPAACSQCGGTTPRIEAHHTDYAKPLAITWLWTFCHFETHGKHIHRGLGSCL